MLQSRIDKRTGSIKEDWEYARAYNICGFTFANDTAIARIKKAEIEQKIDRDILRDLYKLVNREGVWLANTKINIYTFKKGIQSL